MKGRATAGIGWIGTVMNGLCQLNRLEPSIREIRGNPAIPVDRVGEAYGCPACLGSLDLEKAAPASVSSAAFRVVWIPEMGLQFPKSAEWT